MYVPVHPSAIAAENEALSWMRRGSHSRHVGGTLQKDNAVFDE
jgi:hypothetical protein